MREIKFRVWDTSKKYFSVDRMLVFVLEDIIGNPHHREIVRSPDLYPLMQYTGLKDKNGKEIYEGDIYITDIIRRIGEKIGVEMPVSSEKKQIVEWQRCGFSPIEDEERIEIIGNIYENPELLK